MERIGPNPQVGTFSGDCPWVPCAGRTRCPRPSPLQAAVNTRRVNLTPNLSLNCHPSVWSDSVRFAAVELLHSEIKCFLSGVFWFKMI